jgi:tripartite-type tricarboxylate transporter receptor subunit TctC
MASPGFGTPNYMAGELFKTMTGVDTQQVQYRGGASAVADLVGGQVEVMFAVMADAIEYITPLGGHNPNALGHAAGYPDRCGFFAGV